MIKSTVLTSAISGVRRYTAASSAVSKLTNRLGSFDDVRTFSASDKSDGPILAAQPHVRERPVNVFFLKSFIQSPSGKLLIIKLINNYLLKDDINPIENLNKNRTIHRKS